MFPIISNNYSVNAGAPNSVFFPKPGIVAIFSRILSTYFNNLLFSENGLCVLLSKIARWFAAGIRPALSCHIPHIIKAGAKEQVLGLYATRVVATVAYHSPVGYMPLVKKPHYSVGLFNLTIEPKMSVPFCVFAPNPLPAAFGDSYFSPKSFPCFMHFCTILKNETMVNGVVY